MFCNSDINSRKLLNSDVKSLCSMTCSSGVSSTLVVSLGVHKPVRGILFRISAWNTALVFVFTMIIFSIYIISLYLCVHFPQILFKRCWCIYVFYFVLFYYIVTAKLGLSSPGMLQWKCVKFAMYNSCFMKPSFWAFEF